MHKTTDAFVFSLFLSMHVKVITYQKKLRN